MGTLKLLNTACFVTLGLVSAASARAASPLLSRGEREALLAGEVVSRPMRIETDAGSYRGGLSYSLVHAPAAAVLAALSNVGTLPQALPHTTSARLIDVHGAVARVELVQGGGTTYTVRIERTRGRSELRFWLDPTRRHDIDDVFGYFRVEPFGDGSSLVTVAAAVDLGSGLTSLLFSNAVERTVLSTPRQIREFVEPRAFALLDAPGNFAGF
ncbi:MAG: SRPBCC family protein [Polyangiaceae bacterium]